MADEEWHRIGTMSRRTRLMVTAIGIGPFLLLALPLGNLVSRVMLDLVGLWAFALLIPIYGVVILLVSLVVAIVRPALYVSSDAGAFRIRRRVRPAAQLVRVLNRSAPAIWPKVPATELVLAGAADGPLAYLALRSGDRELLDSVDIRLLTRLIELSAIEFPPSRYDPTNRFAQYNFPENLDKAGLIELIQPPSQRSAPASPTPSRFRPASQTAQPRPPSKRGRSIFPW